MVMAMLMVSCGGGATSEGSALTALTDGSHVVSPGITTGVLPRSEVPQAAMAAAMNVDAGSFMDWAEVHLPQFFPTHEPMRFAAPYQFRYYPLTNAYLAVDGQYIRVLGPMFGPNIVTVGKLADLLCQVFPENCMPPTANAGAAQEVIIGSSVTLKGSGTDANGAALTYAWQLSKPLGSTASLNASNIAQPTFVADVKGLYLASLTVSNGTSTSTAATTIVTAKVLNVAPTADAGGSRSVVVGAAAFLSGSLSSDGNGDPLAYQWSLSSPPGSKAALIRADTVSPYVTPDFPGTYVATLVVNDGMANSTPATVSLTAMAVSSYCCRYCTIGKPCGDYCISKTYTCSVPAGCAC